MRLCGPNFAHFLSPKCLQCIRHIVSWLRCIWSFISFRVIKKFLASISQTSATVSCFEQLTSAHIWDYFWGCHIYVWIISKNLKSFYCKLLYSEFCFISSRSSDCPCHCVLIICDKEFGLYQCFSNWVQMSVSPPRWMIRIFLSSHLLWYNVTQFKLCSYQIGTSKLVSERERERERENYRHFRKWNKSIFGYLLIQT